MPLERIKIEGFRSIRALDFDLKPINVLIGANGVGKTNFLDVFPLIHAVRLGRESRYAATRGGAERLLHFGSMETAGIGIELSLSDGLRYVASLLPDEEDRLFTLEELVEGQDGGQLDLLFPIQEEEESAEADITRRLAKWRRYQFHDTSPRSPLRRTSEVADARRLRPDGGNLASFLYRLKTRQRSAYRRIRDAVRIVAPYLVDFVLEPDEDNPDMIRLEWRHARSDSFFDVASLSDGTLRFVALAALLYQPAASRPDIIVIDEPELGLHPVAIGLLAEAVQAASHDSKVILATQSPILVDYFEPEDVVVVDLVEGASEFKRLDNAELKEWLKDYSLGELWEKNHFGGRPA